MALREIGDVGWFDACHSLIESYVHHEYCSNNWVGLYRKFCRGTI
jgi:hypothetical protein